MKLHLPKGLFAAIMATFTVCLSTTVGADIISVNFGKQVVTADSSDPINGSTSARWNNITGDTPAAINGTHSLKSESAETAANLALAVSNNPWAGGPSAGTTLTSQMQNSYLDLSASTIWSIDLASDYLQADLYLYFSGDGGQYSPVMVNGTSYIGGTDTEGTAAWGDRDKADNAAISDTNRIIVTGVSGALHLQNTPMDDTTKRATLSGLQLVEKEVYEASLAAGDNAIAGISWIKGGASSTLANMAAGTRYLKAAANASGSTLTFASNTAVDGIQVSSGTLTLSGGNGVSLTVPTLVASNGATMNVATTLASGSDVTLGGMGTINFTTNQVLGDVVAFSNISLAEGVQILVNGDFLHGVGTITAGAGAALFSNVAANSAVTSGNLTLSSSTAVKRNLVNTEAVEFLLSASSDISIASRGGSVKLSREGGSDITATLDLSLTNGETVVLGGAGVALKVAENLLISAWSNENQSSKTLHISGEGTNFEVPGLIDLGYGAIKVSDGAHLKATSIMMSNARVWGVGESALSVDNALLEITGDVASADRAGNVRLAHWNGPSAVAIINAGEFRAVNTEIGMGDDGAASLSVSSGGIVNSKGIRQRKNSSVTVNGGTLNLGVSGIYTTNDAAQSTVTFTNATVGALHTDGWTTDKTLTINGGTTIQLAVYDIEAKTYSGAANITLSGALNGDGGTLTLAGDGVLTISSALKNAVHVAEGAGATLVIAGSEAPASMTEYGSYTGYGTRTTDGYANSKGYRVAATGSTIAKATLGGELVDVVDGIVVGDLSEAEKAVFWVNTEVNLTDEYKEMAGNTIDVNTGATLTLSGTETHSVERINNKGTTTISVDTTLGHLISDAGTQFTVTNGADVTLTSRDDRSIKGNLTVSGEGSKLIIATENNSDHIIYDGSASQSINVEDNGEINIGSNRWTVSGNTTINLNNGKISGSGQQDHPFVLDYISNATIVSDGTSEISGSVRINRDMTLTATVNSGTLTLSGTNTSSHSGATLKKDGAGTLVLKQGFDLGKGLNIVAGAVQVGADLTIGGRSSGDGVPATSTLKNLSILEGGSLTTKENITINLGSTIAGAAGTTVTLGAGNTITVASLDDLSRSNVTGKNGLGDARYDFISGSTVTLNGATVKVGEEVQTVSTKGGGLYIQAVDTTTYWVVEADNPVTWSSSDTAMSGAANFYVGSEGTLKVGADSSFNKNVTNEGTLNLVGGTDYLNKVTNKATGKVNIVTEANEGIVTLGGEFATGAVLNLTVDTANKTVTGGAGSTYIGDIIIKQGYTLVGATGDGDGQCFGQDQFKKDGETQNVADRYLVVEDGAYLDFAGTPLYYQVKLKEGGTILNSGAGTGATSRCFPKLVLEGDATIANANVIRMIGSGYGPTSLDFGGHTLTKSGAGTFYLRNTTGTAGTLDIQSGAVEFTDEKVNFSATDVKVAENASLIIKTNENNVSEVKSVNGVGTLFMRNAGYVTITGEGTNEIGTIRIGSASTDSARVNLGEKATLKATNMLHGTMWLGGTGTYDIGSALTLTNTTLSQDWNGTVKVVNAQVTSTTDLSGLCANESSLAISGLTVADGAALTLGGNVSLGGTVSTAESLVNNGSITFGSDLKLDLTGMTITDGADGSKVITLLTGAGTSNLASLTDSVLSAATKELGSDWTFNSNGTISFVAAASNLFWEGTGATGNWSDTKWATTDGGTADQSFAANSNVTFSGATEDTTITVDTNATVGTMTVSGATYTYTFNRKDGTESTITANRLVIGEKASAIFRAGSINTGALTSVSVAEGGVLDLVDMTTGIVYTDLMKKLTIATGAGKIKLGSGWGIINDLSVLEFEVDLEVQNAIEVLRSTTDSTMDWNVQNTITVTNNGSEPGKTGHVYVGNNVNLHVKNGGVINAVGDIDLGHTDKGGSTGSEFTISTGGSVTVAAITKSNDSTFTMTGGTLELTGTAGIAAGITTDIQGGKLVANTADWGVTGATISGGVEIAGANTITLTDAQLKGTLTNNGKLALAGTINIAPSADFQTQVAGEQFSGEDGNGFKFADVTYTLASGSGTISVADVTAWQLDGTAATNATYAEGKLNVKGAQQGTLYWANTGTVTYGAEGIAGATGIALNGGSVALNASLADTMTAGLDVKAAGTVTLGDGAELAASQVNGATAANKVTLDGTGIYDLGSSIVLGESVGLADSWQGTVETAVSSITTDTTLALGDKVEFTAETLTLGGILTAGDSTALTMNALSFSSVGDSEGAARLTGSSLTLDSIAVTSDALSGLTTGTWTLVDVDTLTGVTAIDEIAGAGENNLYKYTFKVENGVVTMTGELNGLVWGTDDDDFGADAEQRWDSSTTASNTNVVFNGKCSSTDDTSAGKVNVDSDGVVVNDVTITQDSTLADAQEEYTLTGGDINAEGTLTVLEGTALTVENNSTFKAGVEVNEGSLTVGETGSLTVGTDTTAADMKVDADNGSLTVSAGSSVTVTGKLSVDTIEVAKLDSAKDVMIFANEIAAATDGGKITIDLVDDIVDSVGTGTYSLIKYATGAEIVLDNTDEQAILKKGYWVTMGETSTFALRNATTTYGMSVSDDEDVTWNVGDTAANNRLVVLDGTALKGNDILDNVDIVKVKGSKSISLEGDALSSVTLNKLTADGAGAILALTGDDAASDTATISSAADGYKGTLKLNKLTANLGTAAAPVKGATVVVEGDTVVLSGALEDGTLVVDKGANLTGNSLTLTNSALGIDIGTAGNTLTQAAVDEIMEKGLATVDGVTTDDAFNITIGTYSDEAGFQASAAYDKYFTNAHLENGVVVVERNESYYSDNYAAQSANGQAGMQLADAALLELNPQAGSDLATVLNAIENATSAGQVDELGASLAGASTAVLGMATLGDVDRQLQAIRNRTTTMGVDQSVANEDMPYFNAWINAEGDRSELSESGTESGYELSSWGGTVGFDVDFTPTFTAGMALTAMYGDIDTTGADKASGNIDTYYVTAFARYAPSAWTHTFVATVGMSDISLDRHVAGAEVEGETDGLSFGLMYEVGRVFALTEDGSTCLQPVFNVTWKHTAIDAYTEDGSDLALEVDEQTLDTVTFGLGARLQTVVGESMYNRTSILEARVLAKADVGDRSGSADVALSALPGAKASVDSAEMGAFGLEAGAGLTIPVGDEGGSIFMDASVELRSDYTNVNGTVGYRINF